MNIGNLITNALKEIERNPLSLSELKKNLPSSTVDLLKELEKIGLIKREGDSKLISSCNWSITNQGKAFLRLKERIDKESDNMYEIIMTLPPKFVERITKNHPEIKLTDKAMREIFSETDKTIRILSPYVDATIINYLNKIKENVEIKFLTIPSKYGKNVVLERLKQTNPNLEVKYLFETKDNIQQFQIHAKIIISDKNKIYIGSANFKDTSILYNLEGGIILTHKGIIENHISIYDDIYNSI